MAEKRIDISYSAASQFERISRYASLDTSEHVVSSHYAYDEYGQLSQLAHSTNTAPPASIWSSDVLAG